MGHRRDFQRRRRRGLLPAALALLALLTQLMIPVASLAAETAAARTHTTIVCTAEGAVEMTVPVSPDHHQGFGGLQCHSCVMVSVAALTAGDPLVLPVRYAARIEAPRPGQDRPQTQPRAPPRPPSTAPPAFPTA